eukprot:TRINITY_DN1464_c0_g2_i2.p1 TRINITY_DN1464_c0_g2~~TRINITY_DN1464_c0_g2_i2.p1  ORF type:complete len:376 (-),score=90.05 TRINITY_DN1464_c0_g2_i2:82-1209(-)
MPSLTLTPRGNNDSGTKEKSPGNSKHNSSSEVQTRHGSRRKSTKLSPRHTADLPAPLPPPPQKHSGTASSSASGAVSTHDALIPALMSITLSSRNKNAPSTNDRSPRGTSKRPTTPTNDRSPRGSSKRSTTPTNSTTKATTTTSTSTSTTTTTAPLPSEPDEFDMLARRRVAAGTVSPTLHQPVPAALPSVGSAASGAASGGGGGAFPVFVPDFGGGAAQPLPYFVPVGAPSAYPVMPMGLLNPVPMGAYFAPAVHNPHPLTTPTLTPTPIHNHTHTTTPTPTPSTHTPFFVPNGFGVGAPPQPRYPQTVLPPVTPAPAPADSAWNPFTNMDPADTPAPAQRGSAPTVPAHTPASPTSAPPFDPFSIFALPKIAK